MQFKLNVILKSHYGIVACGLSSLLITLPPRLKMKLKTGALVLRVVNNYSQMLLRGMQRKFIDTKSMY